MPSFAWYEKCSWPYQQRRQVEMKMKMTPIWHEMARVISKEMEKDERGQGSGFVLFFFLSSQRHGAMERLDIDR